MENPALRWGISLLSQMGENTGPAASNSAGESPHSAGFRSFGSGMYLTLTRREIIPQYFRRYFCPKCYFPIDFVGLRVVF
jgi:hypothetical protein